MCVCLCQVVDSHRNICVQAARMHAHVCCLCACLYQIIDPHIHIYVRPAKNVCMHACMCACVYQVIDPHMHICVRAAKNVGQWHFITLLHTCMPIHTLGYIHIELTYIHTYAYTYIYAPIHFTYIRLSPRRVCRDCVLGFLPPPHVCTHVHAYTYMHAHMRPNI
jgi:hypothetical protein